MAKKTPLEKDESALKQKLRERRPAAGHTDGREGLRALRKRLKRVQRKRRRLALRKRHAQGKAAKPEGGQTTAAGA
jgi:hypothetical protein